jgi:hypothetical protein
VRALKLKAVRYCLIDQTLYWKDPLGVFLRCLDPQEAQKVTFDFHSRPLQRSSFLEDHSPQDTPSWVLLAHFIPRCLQGDQSLHQMSKVLRKKTAQIAAIEAYSISSPFSAVGVGLHWRNSSSLKWSTQMDSDSNRLFHQVDRSCPHQKHITQSNYQLPGGYHSQIWLSQQDHHR